MPPTGDVLPDITKITTGLLVDSEVLRGGLRLLLDRIGCTTRVLGEGEPTGDVDVLLVAGRRWRALELAGEPPDRPLVVVLLDADAVDLDPDLPADGFVSVDSLSAEVLEDTLERALRGELPMPGDLARRLLTGGQARIPERQSRAVSLTAREAETLGLLAVGLSNKQIARNLRISTHGAKRLVSAVLIKLGAPNRTAAVVTAMKIGLV
ncbi:LuxR C-terminal-related transcriptional regulator [Dactylosporangium sp. NPDC005572]|uniref:helix-turn-helix transcriptional regulator n=1 Tax=Dactylosporangium sp. NPDC005572 TaxID=3156889 RepID=UPI0033A4BF55